MEKNIFEIAARNKFRFAFRGLISVEDLWDLGLKDLDSIYKTLNAQLKQEDEDSLLDTKTQASEDLSMKIDIIKYIVATKKAEQQAKIDEKEKAAKKQRIKQLIASKEDAAMAEKSPEELRKLLEAIDD